MANKRPNILWMYIEDQDPRYGCYGETLVETPNIDALAAEGVVFERAYSPAPVCSPSRSAVITGSYAIRLGTHVQRSSRFPGEEIYLPEDHKTIPEVFRDAGYFTFNNGKDDYNFARDRSRLYTTGNDEREPDGKVKRRRESAARQRRLARVSRRYALLCTDTDQRRQGRLHRRAGIGSFAAPGGSRIRNSSTLTTSPCRRSIRIFRKCARWSPTSSTPCWSATSS